MVDTAAVSVNSKPDHPPTPGPDPGEFFESAHSTPPGHKESAKPLPWGKKSRQKPSPGGQIFSKVKENNKKNGTEIMKNSNLLVYRFQ